MVEELGADRALGASHPSHSTVSRPIGFDHGERERCIAIAKQVREGFLSEEYAVGQPLSSLQERFACNEVIKALEAEQDKACTDALNGGLGITQDGKRIDLADFYEDRTMEAMRELEERLVEMHHKRADLADALTGVRHERDRAKWQRNLLMEALEPFAAEFDHWKPDTADSMGIGGTRLKVGDLRRAMTVLAKVRGEA